MTITDDELLEIERQASGWPVDLASSGHPAIVILRLVRELREERKKNASGHFRERGESGDRRQK
jgi:hypothetical protein